VARMANVARRNTRTRNAIGFAVTVDSFSLSLLFSLLSLFFVFSPEIADFFYKRSFSGLSLLAPHFARVRASEARSRWEILEKYCEKKGNEMEGI